MTTCKKRTKKTKGGGIFGTLTADNNLVTISTMDKQIKCAICKNDTFQFREGTVGKSKSDTILNDFLFGHEFNGILDISITLYFCNNCGNSIIVRDPKSTLGRMNIMNYDNIIKMEKA